MSRLPSQLGVYAMTIGRVDGLTSEGMMDNCFCASLHLSVPTASTYLLLFFPSLVSLPSPPLSSLPRDVAPTVTMLPRFLSDTYSPISPRRCHYPFLCGWEEARKPLLLREIDDDRVGLPFLMLSPDLVKSA